VLRVIIAEHRVAETFTPANSVAVLVEAGRGMTPSETMPVVLADAGVENVNAQVDELIATGVLRRVCMANSKMLRKSAIRHAHGCGRMTS
jgi:hypothetical protein